MALIQEHMKVLINSCCCHYKSHVEVPFLFKFFAECACVWCGVGWGAFSLSITFRFLPSFPPALFFSQVRWDPKATSTLVPFSEICLNTWRNYILSAHSPLPYPSINTWTHIVFLGQHVDTYTVINALLLLYILILGIYISMLSQIYDTTNCGPKTLQKGLCY